MTSQYSISVKTSAEKTQQRMSTRVKQRSGNFHMSRYSTVWAHKGLCILIKREKGVSPATHPTQSSSTTMAEGKLFQYCQKQMNQPGSWWNSTIRTKRSPRQKALRTCGARDQISWPTGTHKTCAPSHRMCRRWWLPCSCGWCAQADHRCGTGYHGMGHPVYVSLKPQSSLDRDGRHDQRHCTGCTPGRSCTPELCALADGSCCRPVHWCSQQRCGLI